MAIDESNEKSMFDFPNASLPALLPLANSFTQNDIEKEIKQLTIRLFEKYLSADTFDANVLGMAHLGSFNLVRRAIHQDGLAVLGGATEAPATRYLYRAWKAANTQGRGIHFIRTYLQLLFPNVCDVEQLWHFKDKAYPEGCVSLKPEWRKHRIGDKGLRLDGSWRIDDYFFDEHGTESGGWKDLDLLFLTSRLRITLDYRNGVTDIPRIRHILRAVLPARLIPTFMFWLVLVLYVYMRTRLQCSIQTRQTLFYPWKALVITTDPGLSWNLAKNDDKEGPIIGQKIISQNASIQSFFTTYLINPPRIGDFELRVDGRWLVGSGSVPSVTISLVQKSENGTKSLNLSRHTISEKGTPNIKGEKKLAEFTVSAVTVDAYRKRLADATAGGEPAAPIAYMAFGDGAHNAQLELTQHSPASIALKHQILKKPLSIIRVDPSDPFAAIGIGRLEENELNGFVLSEVGLLDANGELIGVSSMAPKAKASTDSFSITMRIRF